MVSVQRQQAALMAFCVIYCFVLPQLNVRQTSVLAKFMYVYDALVIICYCLDASYT